MRTIFRCRTWYLPFIFTSLLVMLWSVFPIHTHIWKCLTRTVLACVLINKISYFLASIQIAAAEIIYLTSTFSYVTLPLHPPSSLYSLPYFAKATCHLFQDLSGYCFFTYHLSLTNTKYWFPFLSAHCDNVSLNHVIVLLLSTLVPFQLRKAPYK